MTMCDTIKKPQKIGRIAKGSADQISGCDTTRKSQTIGDDAEGKTEMASGCDTTDNSRTTSRTEGEEPQPRGGIMKKGKVAEKLLKVWTIMFCPFA